MCLLGREGSQENQAQHLAKLAAISEQNFDCSLISASVLSRVLIAKHFLTTSP